jgi:hypothetical protein
MFQLVLFEPLSSESDILKDKEPEMAVCTSCGSEVDESAGFCTSCGQRMPVSSAAINVTRPICSACSAQVEPGSVFCTNCGQRMATQPAVVEEAAPSPPTVKPTLIAAPPLAVDMATVPPAPVTAPEVVASQSAPPAVPQIAPPIYAAPSEYPHPQPGGSGFRIIVLILLLLILTGGFGGWYFIGVETVIVCSPPDVTVFLDNKEVSPTSYGRYVIPHLSRQPHLLRVQRPGFADTIERLDFPMTSLHEWVNIKLVLRRSTPPSTRH